MDGRTGRIKKTITLLTQGPDQYQLDSLDEFYKCM